MIKTGQKTQKRVLTDASKTISHKQEKHKNCHLSVDNIS